MRFKNFDSLWVLAPMLALACSTAAQESGSASGSTGLSASAGMPATETTPDTTLDPTPDTTAPQGTTSGGTTTGDSGTTEALTSGPTGSTAPGTGTDPGTGVSSSSTTTTTGSGTEGTTGSPFGGACEVDADCKLSSDCCECYGLPTTEEEVPICDQQCLQSKCDELGIDQAVCRFGQCTTEKLDCSGPVACDALPPECPEGTVPGVGDGCWTGACVPAASCDQVPNCGLCPESTMCVENQAQLSTYACEPIPADCQGEPNCECASDACVDPFGLCSNGKDPTDLVCSCPTC